MVDAVAESRVPLLPGAAELLAAAADLGPVGLVSAAPARYVHAAMAALGLGPHLRAVVAGEDVTVGKPAPDPYLRAAVVLAVPPSTCVAVEDSAAGIRSAHAAGMTVLAVPNAHTALDAEVLSLATHVAVDAYAAAAVLPVLAGRTAMPV
jgi:HAD superfamily hydrolase (TIGR01509 family)